MKKYEDRIIEYADILYPDKLREIKNPPLRLYTKGNIELLNSIGIAIVGSRTNTQYGEKMCKTFTKKQVEYEVTIISGLAIGIDAIAHKICIKYFGKTIAVLPCGFDIIYPKQNKELIDEILEKNGLIITEYEKDVKAESKKFLERNRIVAGLGIGTLVIEAGYRSGTSVTARYTKNLNKPVFCVPSSLENSKGLGTNEIIKNGSKLVTKVEDILIEYPQIKFKKKLLKEREKQVPKELEKVYKCIKNEPANINQIVRKTKMSIQDISYKIMLLQLENLIEELPGQVYRIKNGEDDE